MLDRLDGLPIDEIIVVNNGGPGLLDDLVEGRPKVRVLAMGSNLGSAGRNIAAKSAASDLLLMLDDDSYPLPGAIEELIATFRTDPRVAAVGGFVSDVDAAGNVLRSTQVGTFDWFLRAGRDGMPGPEGFAAFFFPEGACMIRTDAFLECGGFPSHYFLNHVELDLSTRLLARGWDVRYQPRASFEHLKGIAGRAVSSMLRLRTRNQIWYFWTHFPVTLALRRIPAYLLFDLVECLYRKAPHAWLGGMADAWRQRAEVQYLRAPLSRQLIRRAEMNRGRMHVRLLLNQLGARFRRRSTK